MAAVRRVPADRPGNRNLLIIGGNRSRWRDVYYSVLAAKWWMLLVAYVVLFTAVNAVFAALYRLTGGVQGVEDYQDAFFFSVQTWATIGYGGMHPTGGPANILATLQAMCGLLGVAVLTGLAFAKLARPTARVMFSNIAVITRRDGVPSLIFRAANERGNAVVEAQMRVTLLRDEKTAEGEPVRRLHDLALVRSSSPTFVLSWTVIHKIAPDSPLHGATPELLDAWRAQIVVSLIGLDDTLAQTIHARHTYTHRELIFGHRLIDVMATLPTGELQIDYRRFHEVEPDGL